MGMVAFSFLKGVIENALKTLNKIVILCRHIPKKDQKCFNLICVAFLEMKDEIQKDKYYKACKTIRWKQVHSYFSFYFSSFSQFSILLVFSFKASTQHGCICFPL